MSARVFAIVGCVAVGLALVGPACGGSSDSDLPPASSNDAGNTDRTDAGDDGSTGAVGECSVDADCAAKLPATTPPDCAVATCDALQKKCRFKAKDADNDGHTAKACSAATVTIETGDDCDDGDPNTYPGAWDGTATDFDAGAGVQVDRCDQKDNDCNGSPDDGKLAVDGGDKTCKCDPNKPLPCYEYSNGIPIDPGTLDGENNPKGACKKGTRSCPNGIPGQCVGAVGPQPFEQCTDQDLDCDGVSGNAGDVVTSAPTVCRDADGDGYCTADCKQVCVPPSGYRLQSTCAQGGAIDCNDTAGATGKSIHPGATELCGDGVDSNCTNGDSDPSIYPNLGKPCTAGNNGVCKRAGTYVCSEPERTSTTCNVTAGSAVTSGKSTMSTDALIDMSQQRAGYDPRWDWDCNNVQEVSTYLQGGTFRATACGGNYQSACDTLTTEAACNSGPGAGFLGVRFFNCDHLPGTFFWYATDDVRQCGATYRAISCLWLNDTCKYLDNYDPAFGQVVCK